MPLAERTIEPVYLGRRPLKEEEQGDDVVAVSITQNCVLGALVQLASLVRHADDLFCDLADECQNVFDKSERILQRVKRIKEGVGCLDSKKVPIPVGDLKRFSAVQDHHVAKHGFDSTMFTPESRPHCIKARYSLCEVTPVGILRGADPYRKDGLRSSNLFKLWPIVLNEHEAKTPDLSLHRKQGPAMTFSKKYKRLTPRRRTVHGIDSLELQQEAADIDSVSISSASSKRSNRGANMSKSQPSILVAVDTSGVGFERMTSFRQSLKSSGTFPKGTQSLDRKSRRRRTVSGVPDNIMQEIELFERGKRSMRSTPRDYSFDDLDTKRAAESQQAKEDAMMQYIDELDAKMEEKAEVQRASREPRILKFLPCRRSRSLPRCIKVGEKVTEKGAGQLRGVMAFDEEKLKVKDKSAIATAASGYHSSSHSLASTGASSTSSKATRRSSISSKIRSFVTGTLKPRPKSLDLDAIDVLGNDADVEDDSSVSTVRGKVTLTRRISPSMPDDISSISSSRESKVGPGTYYYFTSSTLPRAQARKYDFPWDSLPKDWTTAVKLREISKRRKEERNSSSGNWSGSSNRQSLDSARSSTLPLSVSQHSLSRDSGRDSPTMPDDRDDIHLGEKSSGITSADTGMSTFQPVGTATTIIPGIPTSTISSNNNGVDSDTEQWLTSLAKRAAEREDAGDASDSLARLSELTKQNIQALEDTFSPGTMRPLRLDDEVSSVHSLDCEGFYTSFHTDSGLRRSTGTLLDSEDGELTPVKESQSSFSLGSTNTIDSVIFRPMGRAVPGQNSNSSGKLRPPPPVRSSSRLSSVSMADADNTDKNTMDDVSDVFQSAADSPETSTSKDVSNPALLRSESSPSDQSDQETTYARLKVKTAISSRSIPSWCSISDEDSTDSSNVYLNGASPQNATSVSLSGSATENGASTNTPSAMSEATEVGSGTSGKGGVWNSSTLPHRYLDSKLWEEDGTDQSNSWPRSRRSQHQPTAGILKRDKSPAGSLKQKTLNFAPVVSMFDQHTPEGVEFPLHPTSSCSSLDWSSESSVSGLSYQLSEAPMHSDGNNKPSVAMLNMEGGKASQILLPYSVVRPVDNMVAEQTNGVQILRDTMSGSSNRSVSSSESSLPSLSDCGQGGYRDMSGSLSHRAPDTWSYGSSTSTGLSDSSLTQVTSSNHSTPTNSTLTLNTDDLATPVNSPQRKRDPYSFEQAALSALVPEVGPVLQAPKFDRAEAQNNGQSLGSFAANASTEAAPLSWMEERLNGRTLSGDSGFSSPTTPTGVSAEQSHHRHHHHPQSSRRPHTITEAQVHNSDVFFESSNGNGVSYSRSRNSLPPSQLSPSHRHNKLLKASHSADKSIMPTPRSDSYRAATKDILMMENQKEKTKHYSRDNPRHRDGSRHGRRSLDSAVRPKTRPHSAAQFVTQAAVPSSSSLSSRAHMTKSMSCPTGVVADTDLTCRADSYRMAVRNTQGILGDLAARNTSYRMATRDEDTAPDSRMDAINAWDNRSQSSGSKDIRRRGITDIDQLKCYDSDSSSSRHSVKSTSSHSFAGINSSRKKMTPEVQQLLRGNKSPSTEVKRLSKSSDKGSKDKDKSKRSSTYIRFDPIFELGDEMYSSTNTLRAESVEMITSEDGFLMSDKIVGQLPPGRVRGSSGRKHVDDKAVMSILDSIKTTIKSMSSKNNNATADKDMWRYEGGI